MKRLIYKKRFVLLCGSFVCAMSLLESCYLVASAGENSSGLSVSADSAIVICADNGKVIFAKNENKERPMASTTKIMTGLLTLENAERNNKEITIDDRMVPVEGSSMYLKVGDVLTLEDLAKGMLSVSGNDAAHSAAIAIGGSVEGFADMMNEKARQIGMKNTHFVTPSGLDKDDHHSTAYDMALLGAYAMENKMFFDIVSHKKVDVHFIKPEQTRVLRNENRLLREYEGCVGIKTGFTSLARRCLVSCAERNNVRLVAVTLNAPDDWSDHKRMFDYGFDKLESIELGCDDIYSVQVVGGEKCCMTAGSKSLARVTVPKGSAKQIKKRVEMSKFEYAPIQENQILGKVVYVLDGQDIATVELFSKEQIDTCYIKKNFFKRVIDFFCGRGK